MNKDVLFVRQMASKTFTAKSCKEAYMSAAKWYASNVIAKDDKLQDVQVAFEKGRDGVMYTMTIKLYASLPVEELKSQYCTVCKEAGKAFYRDGQAMQQVSPCSSCDMAAFIRRLDQKAVVKSQYYKEQLRWILRY